MIKLQAIGHLGKDAETRQVNGKTVINFSIAHTEKYTSNGEQKEKTILIECTYWTEKTGIAPFLKKGTQVYIEGRPEIRTYQTQSGQNGASLTCRILSVQLLGGGQQGASNAQQQQGNGYVANQQTSANKPYHSHSNPQFNEMEAGSSDGLPF